MYIVFLYFLGFRESRPLQRPSCVICVASDLMLHPVVTCHTGITESVCVALLRSFDVDVLANVRFILFISDPQTPDLK